MESLEEFAAREGPFDVVTDFAGLSDIKSALRHIYRYYLSLTTCCDDIGGNCYIMPGYYGVGNLRLRVFHNVF